MRLVLQHANIHATDHLDRWVEQCLRAMLPLVRIEEAKIRLEYRPETSPPYRASGHLAIPGPDLRMETVDHTPQTALAKLMAGLRWQAAQRAARRLRRTLPDARGFFRLGRGQR